jgi:hypothetical protein
MKRAALPLAMLAVGAGLLASAAARGGDSGESIRNGGTFRVSFWASDFDHMDPARLETRRLRRGDRWVRPDRRLSQVAGQHYLKGRYGA